MTHDDIVLDEQRERGHCEMYAWLAKREKTYAAAELCSFAAGKM